MYLDLLGLFCRAPKEIYDYPSLLASEQDLLGINMNFHEVSIAAEQGYSTHQWGMLAMMGPASRDSCDSCWPSRADARVDV